MTITAIIGGTGLTELESLELTAKPTATELGEPSSVPQVGSWHGQPVVFLSRHGQPHGIAPHRINYRANLLALQALGVTRIIAVNAVGGIHPDMGSGAIAVPHQLVDYTWGRESTFFDGDYRPLQHIDLTHPYDEALRRQLLQAAEAAEITVHDRAVYAATQGPRLETVAEIQRLERDGCDLVGMTGMPEAALARELEIPYASVCLVVNPAAGKSNELITMEYIRAVLAGGMQQVIQIIEQLPLSDNGDS